MTPASLPFPDVTLNQGRSDMNSKILGALAAVALLAACADKNTGASTGAGAATSGPVPGSQEDLVANVGDRVFFDFDRSTLKSDAQATLDRQSGWLAKYPQVNVQLAGNCDDRGTKVQEPRARPAPCQFQS